MKQRIYILRGPGMGGPQQPNPFGCLIYLLGVIGTVVLAIILLPMLLAIAFAIGLGIIAAVMMVVAYFRIRAWLRRKSGKSDKPARVEPTYKAEVIDGQDDDNAGAGPCQADWPRVKVDVRRRPHHE